MDIAVSSKQTFARQYCCDVVRGGMFLRLIPWDHPPIGTPIRFRFVMPDGNAVFAGEGRVSLICRNDPGIGIRFDWLSAESHQLHRSLLRLKKRTREARLAAAG